MKTGRTRSVVDRMTLVVNVVLFQVGWFACVLGAAYGLPLIGALAAGVIIVWHLARAVEPKKEMVLIAVALMAGALFDTLLVQKGWVRFATGVLVEGTAPYWMIALWAIFATTLNVSLRPLRPHLGLAALFGAIGGPAAYYAGTRLGAIEFVTAGAAIAIGIGWAILTPALLSAARRMDGYLRP